MATAARATTAVSIQPTAGKCERASAGMEIESPPAVVWGNGSSRVVSRAPETVSGPPAVAAARRAARRGGNGDGTQHDGDASARPLEESISGGRGGRYLNRVSGSARL